MHTHRSSNTPPLPEKDVEAATAAQCSWSAADEEMMITFLCSKKEAAADGSTFRSPVWNALIKEMALHHSTGAPKTVSACKSKYGRLRNDYRTVTTIKGLSGLGQRWDDEKGMDIGLQEAEPWAVYCTKHSKAKKYTQKGFPLYQLMSGLMPSLGKGTHAFRPSNQTQGASSAVSMMAPEPISDDEATTDASAMQPPATHPPALSPSTSSLHGAETHELPPLSSPPASVGSSRRDMPSPSSQLVPHTSGPSTSSTSKRKYSALEASQSGQTSSAASGKKQRSAIPGAVALNGIKESLDMFNKTIERSFNQPQEHVRDTSPERRQKAMARLQEVETHLDDERLIALIDLFKAETIEADTYMSLQRDALRKKWLQKQLLERCGFPADDVVE